MSEFSATDAAFEGFRVARERPWAIVAWAGVALAMVVADLILRSTLADLGAIENLFKMSQSGTLSMQALLEVVSKESAYFAASIPISLLYYGIMFAAAFRVVIEPDSSKNGLQVGVQELRQTWLLILNGLVLFFANVGILFVISLVVGAVAMASRSAGAFLSFIGVLVWIAASFIVPIRLSLSGPQTFTEHRLRPFNSWALTRNRFWPIAGTYVLATVFAVIVFVLGLSVLAGAVALTGQSIDAAKLAEGSLQAYLNPPMIIYMIGYAILMAMIQAIIFCPAAVIYQHISREERR